MVKTNMMFARKKRQTNRRLLSQLHDFDHDIIVGNAKNNRQENTTVIEGTTDQEVTVGNSNGGSTVNENVVNVETFENCFNGKVDKEKRDIVDTVQDRIQSAILTAMHSIFTPKIELGIRSKNASSWTGGDQCHGKFR